MAFFVCFGLTVTASAPSGWRRLDGHLWIMQLNDHCLLPLLPHFDLLGKREVIISFLPARAIVSKTMVVFWLTKRLFAMLSILNNRISASLLTVIFCCSNVACYGFCDILDIRNHFGFV